MYWSVSEAPSRVTAAYRENRALVVAEPRSPLECNRRAGPRHGVESGGDQRALPTGDIRGGDLLHGAGSLGVDLLVSPSDALDTGEGQVHTGVKGRIAATVSKSRKEDGGAPRAVDDCAVENAMSRDKSRRPGQG
jgi:hypothetical protein